jgi:hypothetical protein
VAGDAVPGELPLAAALIAAAAMVWQRRRHRYVPRPVSDEPLDDPDLRPLPPVVNRLRHAVREQHPDLLDPPPAPRQPTVAQYADADTDEFELPPIGPSGIDLAGLSDQVPAGGLGLTGPGSEPAARALLVATLSTGSPIDPDARGQVVIPADALTTLLGAHSVEIGAIPRLTVTPTLSDALMRVEELLIERRRQLQEYDAADLPALRAAEPYHPPMPPVLLLAEVPPPELRARLSTTLYLGTPLQISAVLLGEWLRGDTVTVRADGRTTADDGQRLAVLDVPTTLQLLHVLREAHTGQPARCRSPNPSRTPIRPTARLATRSRRTSRHRPPTARPLTPPPRARPPRTRFLPNRPRRQLRRSPSPRRRRHPPLTGRATWTGCRTSRRTRHDRAGCHRPGAAAAARPAPAGTRPPARGADHSRPGRCRRQRAAQPRAAAAGLPRRTPQRRRSPGPSQPI